MLKIAVVLEPDEDGGFTAQVPTIPGCFSEGETIEETIANIREAIEMILEATDDDLVVGEKAKVFVLEWEAAPFRQVATEPADRSAAVPGGAQKNNLGEAKPTARPASTQAPQGTRRRGLMIDPDLVVPDPDESESEG